MQFDPRRCRLVQRLRQITQTAFDHGNEYGPQQRQPRGEVILQVADADPGSQRDLAQREVKAAAFQK